MEDIIDIIVTETTNTIEITAQPNDEIIDVNIIDNREDIVLNVTPTVVEININSLVGNFGVLWGQITGTLSNQTDLQTVLNVKADLVGGLVPSSQLPSFVDDVIEVATFAALPVTGEQGKIYVVLATNLIYRWSGSAYIEIKDSSAVWGAITGTLSSQTDLQNALNAKEPTITAGTTLQYYRGDKTFQTLNTSIVPELTNLYYTEARVDANANVAANTSARHSAVTIGTANGLSLSTQILSLGLASSIANGALSSTDWTTFNSKQAALNGTGFVKISGTTISYDNSTYYLASNPSSFIALTALSGGAGISYNNTTGVIASTITQYTDALARAAISLTVTGSSGASTYNNTTGVLNVPTYTLLGLGGQPLATNLTSLSGLAFVSTSFVKMTAAGTFALDTNTYALSSALSAYLPLTGGTLTGALSGTSATFSGDVTLSGASGNRTLNIQTNTSGDAILALTAAGFDSGAITYKRSTGDLIFSNSGASSALKIANTGAATFSSSVTAGATITNLLSGGDAILYAKNGTVTTMIVANTTGELVGIGGTESNHPYIIRTNNTERMRITSAGNVGIGATAPNSILEIAATTPAFRIQASDSVNFHGIEFRQGAGYDAFIKQLPSTGEFRISNGRSVGWGGFTTFYTDTSERMRITSGGNVGIGTTAPSEKLEVEGRINIKSGYALYLSNGNNTATAAIVNGEATSTSSMLFYTGGAERMRITSGGLVGIGTNNPTVALGMGLVINGGATSPRIALKNTASGDASTDGFQIVLTTDLEAVLENRENASMRFLTNATEAMRITAGGEMLINMTSTTTTGSGTMISQGTAFANLRLFGTGSQTFSQFFLSGTAIGSITGAGSVTSYNVTSDYRLKQDLKPIKGLEIVNKINVYDYEWKADKTRMDGVLAHELAEVLPYAVTGIKDGEQMQSVDYSKIVPVMVQAIKELKKELDLLKNK